MKIDWTPLREIIASKNRFVLTTHVRPDADAIGSQIAMAGLPQWEGQPQLEPEILPQAPLHAFIRDVNSIGLLRLDRGDAIAELVPPIRLENRQRLGIGLLRDRASRNARHDRAIADADRLPVEISKNARLCPDLGTTTAMPALADERTPNAALEGSLRAQ